MYVTLLRDMCNSYVYNTGREENQFFQPHLDDAHSKLVHRSNYLHFGTTSNRQISKATTQGWRPPAFTKRKSRNNLMSRSSLNNLRECFHVDCMSEYFRICFTVTFNAFNCHFCPRLVSKYVGKHLPFESGPSTYVWRYTVLKVEFHLHETLNMQHARSWIGKRSSECRWTKTSYRSGNLKAIKQSPSGHDLQLENVSKCGRCPAFPIWTCQQHEYPTAARGKTNPSASMHSLQASKMASIHWSASMKEMIASVNSANSLNQVLFHHKTALGLWQYRLRQWTCPDSSTIMRSPSKHGSI